ncbi:aldehyde dehydrogenase family protein [Gemmobacter serpentinus]|uniref:aldehyde dehydrogenase family protein n=1 Tax=Gemmobacter serpentinus TaxID=2652247 RepID=UPI00124BDD72|nr:aldehyde dehydrogenase family protein [Gemmobacter serpentinus]
MNIAVPPGLLGAEAAAFLQSKHQMLIGGKWVDGQSGKTFDVFDPANGRKITSVPEADKSDVDRAVAAARQAFDHGPWTKMTPTERSVLIWRLADLLDKYGDELAQIESVDNGKPVRDARAVDVGFGIDLLRYMAGWCTKITGDVIPMSVPGEWHAYTLREPVGVCAQIVPWNFPLLMSIWKIAPAFAAGCTVVLKPAEQTPLTALRLGQIIQEAGFPDGVFNVVTGDGRTGAALVEHPDVDKVAFTGSTEVGKLIVKGSAGNLKKVSVELGGKSPQIVFPDADMDHTIAGTASGIFFNAGQCCTAGSRIYAHKSIFDKLMAGLADEASKLKIGRGLLPDTNIGPVISQEQFDKINGYLEAGKRDGAEVVTGGERWGSEGYFIKPTVFAHTNPQMSVVREEIFGPVVCAMPYDDDDLDKIALEANNTQFGLGASIWTRDMSVAHKLARKIKAGTVWVNSHLTNDVALPFGGFKQSGWGREMGREAIELYTQVKSVAIRL